MKVVYIKNSMLCDDCKTMLSDNLGEKNCCEKA